MLRNQHLKLRGEHTVHLAFLADLNKFDTATESSFRQQISIEELIDCFFVNPYIKMDEAFFNDEKVKGYININDLPHEIQGAIKARDDIFSWPDFVQGSAFGLMNRFRSDELHTRFVIPFLSLFQG